MSPIAHRSPLPWRAGRKVFRTLYDAQDRLIGVMDHAEDAAFIVSMGDLMELLERENERLRAENAEFRRRLGEP